MIFVLPPPPSVHPRPPTRPHRYRKYRPKYRNIVYDIVRYYRFIATASPAKGWPVTSPSTTWGTRTFRTCSWPREWHGCAMRRGSSRRSKSGRQGPRRRSWSLGARRTTRPSASVTIAGRSKGKYHAPQFHGYFDRDDCVHSAQSVAGAAKAAAMAALRDRKYA